MVASVAGLVADSVTTGLLVVTSDHRVVWANASLLRFVTSRTADDVPDAAGSDAAGPPVARTADPVMAGRIAVAGAGLPLEGIVPGAEPVRVMWHGAGQLLQIACRELDDHAMRSVNLVGGEPFLLFEIAAVPYIDTVPEPFTGPETIDLPEPVHRRDDADAPGGAVGTADDSRLALVEAIARIGTWEWDLATDTVTLSDALLVMLGFPPGRRLDYRTVRAALHPDDIALIESTVQYALADREAFEYIHRVVLADGVTERVMECYGDIVNDSSGEPARVMGTAHDVTEQYRVQRELAYLAEHDPLTGLFNRRSIAAFLDERLAADAGRTGALLLLDIDSFKDVNDVRGHAAGDQVMRALTQVLREELPEALLGRLGGDEFAVVTPDGDAVDGLLIAEALCETIARHPVMADGAPMRVTVSIGVAPLNGARGCDSLLAMADLALYEAKSAGRNCARLFVPEQYDEVVRRVSVAERVRHALDSGLMAVDVQPIVELATAGVRGYELLVRLRDGQTPELSPADFLGTVERTDLVLRLDRWVVGQAIGALATRRARQAGLRLAVNISSRSLEDPNFGDFVLGSLHAARVAPGRLELEITEVAAITSVDAARRLADQLTAAGCSFTLDDFGAGFGSFVYLRNLPFTTVKIDGDFVRDCDSNPVDTVLVDAIVRVARSLGMSTTAENVDRESLVSVLRDLGVECAQGFHLGRPFPLARLVVDEPAPPVPSVPPPSVPPPPPPPGPPGRSSSGPARSGSGQPGGDLDEGFLAQAIRRGGKRQ